MQECKIAISKAQMQRCRRARKSATLQKQHKDAKEACKNANLQNNKVQMQKSMHECKATKTA